MANYKKNTKKKIILKNIEMFLNQDASDEIIDEIIDVISGIPFNKISIPLNAYRRDIMDDPNSTKSITVGFIRSFNEETNTFDVMVFDSFKETIDNFECCGIEVNFGIWNGSLSKINKLSLINVTSKNEESEDVETECSDEPVE